jgi:hypothetical protein
VRGLLYIARARLARSGVPIGSHSNVTCGDRMRGGCASASADARSTEHVVASYGTGARGILFLLLGSCIKRAGACKYLGTLYARMRGGVAILLTA